MSLPSPRILPRPIARTDQHCAGCGYELHGLVITRCPECGLPFEQDEQVLAAVPWVQRRLLGRWHAFWKTVWLVLTRPSHLVRQVQADVELEMEDGASFRHICIAIASISIALAMVLYLLTLIPRPSLAEIGVALPVALLSALLFFYFATFPLDRSGFERANDERRFRRLHDFTAAPLAAMPIVPLLNAVYLFRKDDNVGVLSAGTALILLALLHSMLDFQHRAARRTWVWLAGTTLAVLFYWSFLGAVAIATYRFASEWAMRWIPGA